MVIPEDSDGEDLLVPIFRGGQRVYEPPTLEGSRSRAKEQLASLPKGVIRLDSPDPYPVGVGARLLEVRTYLMRQAGG